MLVVQVATDVREPSPDDLAKTDDLEALVTEAIETSGTGACDGSDIGSGTINIFCVVEDTAATAACKAIVTALDKAGIAGAVIAYFDDDDEETEPNVLYPADYTGTFSVL